MHYINIKNVICVVTQTLLFFFPSSVHSQFQQAGLPYIQNFTPQEYGAHSQNWAIAQDQRGLIYVGNTNGLLEYDGVTWRLIKPSGKARIVLSLAIDNNNRIYVGSYNEFGYLAPDSIGQMHYISLMDRLPQTYHQCKHVWYAHVVDQSVYFMTPKYIFRYTNGIFKVWEASTTYRKTFLYDQKLFVKQENLGLMQLQDDSLQAVSGTNILKNNYVFAILPHDEENTLIGTLEKGLYQYNGTNLMPFSASSRRLIIDSKCAGGLMLADSSIALSSYKNGVIVLNRNGELTSIINTATGLINNFIISMYVDMQNGLWLATNNGLARIELPSQFSYYDEQLGLEGKVENIIRHQTGLLVATSQGIYQLPNEARPDVLSDKHQLTRTFEKIQGINTQCWKLLPFGSNVVAATRNGIYHIVQNRSNLVGFENQNVYCLVRSKSDSNRIFIGLSDGIAAMYYDSMAGWTNEGKMANFNERIRWMDNDNEDALWMCTSHNGVWRIAFSDNNLTTENIWSKATPTHMDTSYGLPSMDGNRVFTIDNHLIWGTAKGLYIFDRAKQRFIPQHQLGLPAPKDSWRIVRLAEGINKNLWMFLQHSSSWELGTAIHQHINSYQWFSQPFYRYATSRINSIYAEKNDICWFGGDNGIVRYDATIPKDYSKDFAALIRRVLINGDSTLYAGAVSISDELSSYTKVPPVLAYNKSALRFEYTATSFDMSSANRFQYFLDGFDDDWSDWTLETTKDYTNIPEGIYQFKVRAQNIYKHISSVDVFAFEVMPPWYRTVWAYHVYALFFISIIAISVKWRSRHLEKEKLALEQLVSERTEEVRVQAKKLQEMDKLKSRFFANISHEFRTPLTLIIDPLNEMIAGTFKGDSGHYFNIMKQNAVRLLRLINQLLDLSRLESGGMALQAKFGDIVPLIKGLVNSFSSIAHRKNIDLKCNIKPNGISLYFDKDKVEKIVTNLLSNAFKFTPEDGTISVTVLVVDNKTSPPEYPTDKAGYNHIQIKITDTGIGIPEDRLPYIFDRFYSIDSQHMSEQAGSGIGLALTKELVDLHHGEISVKNRKGGGTEFIVRLPLDKEVFNENEISDESYAAVEPSPDLSLLDAAEDEAQEEHSDELQTIEESDSRNLILVVEDNTDVRNYIKDYLASEYDVVEAPNGKKGVEIAIQTIPDLIISDVMMPEMDGYELCRILKKDNHTNHIPIILLTAKAEDSDKITGLKTGADDYLIKPFNSRELLTRIKNLIDVRHKLQEKYKMEFLLQPDEVAVESIDDAFVKKACEIVEENMDDPDFSVEIFAHKIAMSRGNLHRKLRAVVNQSASDFIRALRLKRAAQLLQRHTGNITEVSFQVGFTSSAYFAKCFREQFGISPSEYSKK